MLELKDRNEQYILPGFKMEMEKNESNDLDSNQKAGFVKGTIALQLGLCE